MSCLCQVGYFFSSNPSPGRRVRLIRKYYDHKGTSATSQEEGEEEEETCRKPSLHLGHRHRFDLVIFSCVVHQHISKFGEKIYGGTTLTLSHSLTHSLILPIPPSHRSGLRDDR
jgi:hypothetical protein